MSEKHVVIATFSLPTEAYVACGRLQAEGIPAHVTGDLASGTFAGFGAVGGRVELYVPESACEKAMNVLAECMPEEQWRVMLGKELQPAESPASEWTSDDRVKPGGEFESERDSPLWVCSLCGDALPVEETVCPSCGTAREALRPARSEQHRENRPAQRTTDIQKEKPVVSGTSLASGFEVPEVDEKQNRGDAIASRAMKAALLTLVFSPVILMTSGMCGLWILPLVLVTFGFLGQLLMYQGELTPRGMRNLYIAVVLDVILVLFLIFLWWPLFARFMR